MRPQRLTAVDAQSFWMSAKIPNDTVLLFGFGGVPTDLDGAVDALTAQAARCAELTVRVDDAAALSYPRWARCGVAATQIVVHDLADATWAGCLAATVGLTAEPLDARVRAWRLHVFPGIVGIPGVAGPGVVAVLQISHALGGGGRTALSAALMFGRVARLPEVDPLHVHPGLLPVYGFGAGRAQRRLVADTEAGLVPPPAAPCPALRTNARPTGASALRTVVRRRAQLRGPTVTVGALSAIACALAGHLDELGEDPSALQAELMIAKQGPRRSYNHFGAAGVALHPRLTEGDRAERIATAIAARRLRAAHPAMRAQELAVAATPAPLLRWGMGRFDPTVRVAEVTGNTVVSSVNCGAADFAFHGMPVTVFAAFPGLSPMMGLTHCVSGVGETISVSVHAAESAIGDVDSYVARLEAALGPA